MAIFGVIGTTLPPLALNRHMKHARNSLVKQLDASISAVEKRDHIDYCLVTMDRETGPWICNYLRNRDLPYIAVISDEQLFTPKLRYWYNQATSHIEVPFNRPREIDLAPAILRKSLYSVRNNWLIDQSDYVFVCALRHHSEFKGVGTCVRIQALEEAERQVKAGKLTGVWTWDDKAASMMLHKSHQKQQNRSKRASTTPLLQHVKVFDPDDIPF